MAAPSEPSWVPPPVPVAGVVPALVRQRVCGVWVSAGVAKSPCWLLVVARSPAVPPTSLALPIAAGITWRDNATAAALSPSAAVEPTALTPSSSHRQRWSPGGRWRHGPPAGHAGSGTGVREAWGWEAQVQQALVFPEAATHPATHRSTFVSAGAPGGASRLAAQAAPVGAPARTAHALHGRGERSPGHKKCNDSKSSPSAQLMLAALSIGTELWVQGCTYSSRYIADVVRQACLLAMARLCSSGLDVGCPALQQLQGPACLRGHPLLDMCRPAPARDHPQQHRRRQWRCRCHWHPW